MAGRRNTFAFWIAVAMATVCLALVLMHGTTSRESLETGHLSLIWVAGGAAIFAIFIHEFLDSISARRERPRRRVTKEEPADVEVGELTQAAHPPGSPYQRE